MVGGSRKEIRFWNCPCSPSVLKDKGQSSLTLSSVGCLWQWPWRREQWCVAMGTSWQARPGPWGALREHCLSPVSVSPIFKQHMSSSALSLLPTRRFSLWSTADVPPSMDKHPWSASFAQPSLKGWGRAARNPRVRKLCESCASSRAVEAFLPVLKGGYDISGWPGSQPTPLQTHCCCYPAQGWSLQGVWASAHLMPVWGDVF